MSPNFKPKRVNSGFEQYYKLFLGLGVVSVIAVWLYLAQSRPETSCNPDNEGSWGIGVFTGDSPFDLQPIESSFPRADIAHAWPVANPVLHCGSVTDQPSNFVADPFLFQRNGVLYLFFESKSVITNQGDIGVAQSEDGGVTWQYLGIVIDEKWHLSYPFVFEYEGEIYLVPESSQANKAGLRAYKAVDFPMKWVRDKKVFWKSLIDASLLQHDGLWWLFGSNHNTHRRDHRSIVKNGQLDIYYSETPFGPWKSHADNPVYNGPKSVGARMAGRPLVHDGVMYRFGQDCGSTYGHHVKVFRIDELTPTVFRETEVVDFSESLRKGLRPLDWNSARQHHYDAVKLPNGKWLAVMDGDRVPSGAVSAAWLRFGGGVATCAFVALLLFRLKGTLHAGTLAVRQQVLRHASCSSKDPKLPLRYRLARMGHTLCFGSGHGSASSCRGTVARMLCFGCIGLGVVTLIISALAFWLVLGFYTDPNNSQGIPIAGHYSKFSIVVMTFDARLKYLERFVPLYSQCPSVGEIVVVWNGSPEMRPSPESLNSAVPIRVRQETVNSLNNRFRPDPEIRYRAVLSLDDDIGMTCGDLERAFAAWRMHPERMVGWYPRLIDGRYHNERYAWQHGEYNGILTGACFLDHDVAYPAYTACTTCMAVVDELFNGEDITMNFIMANRTADGSVSVQYLYPRRRVDCSKFSFSVPRLSANNAHHVAQRSEVVKRQIQNFGRDPLKRRKLTRTPQLFERDELPHAARAVRQ